MSKYLQSVKVEIEDIRKNDSELAVKERIIQLIQDVNSFSWSDSEKLKLIMELTNIGLEYIYPESKEEVLIIKQE